MIIENFLKTRFDGERFEGHSIPLELLGDLAVLEAMIIEVAKWQFFQDNPTRERAPRGFTDGVSLTLTAVGKGSAIAEIALSLPSDARGQLFSVQQESLQRARDAIVNAIAAAAESKNPTLYLPPEALGYFDRLGRRLQDNEAIEFSTDTTEVSARLTREARRRLLQASEVRERSEEVHIRGGIFDFNQETLDFLLMLPGGTKVGGRADSQHFDTFMKAHSGYKNGVKALIEGLGKFNRAERLQSIESVEHMTVLDPLDFISQLEELNLLEDGWYDGKGRAPSSEGLDWLAQAFDENFPDDLPLPYVYPTVEGNVRLEWSLGQWEISIEIDLQKRSGQWHALNLDSDKDQEKELNLLTGDDWLQFTKMIRELSKKVP